jgi:hypothetical protein
MFFEETMMSFPSAITRLEGGDTPKEAMAYAMMHDTNLGFAAIKAVADARTAGSHDPVDFVRNRLPPAAHKDVLRAELRGDAIVVDFDPMSKTGLQIARLLGTDAARPLMEELTGFKFGFANCCKILAGPTRESVHFTIKDQIRWQHAIDC